MSEKDLNIKYICNKTLLDEKDELVPIILEMIQESYRAGLCQSEFDNTMELIEENVELKKKLNELQKPQIFIDTQDIEERYGEGKYQDYLEEQVKELKKQLEDKEDFNKKLQATKDRLDKYNYKITMQQQEFIKYLEDYLSLFDYNVVDEQGDYDMINEILTKYKEIIGGNKND